MFCLGWNLGSPFSIYWSLEELLNFFIASFFHWQMEPNLNTYFKRVKNSAWHIVSTHWMLSSSLLLLFHWLKCCCDHHWTCSFLRFSNYFLMINSLKMKLLGKGYIPYIAKLVFNKFMVIYLLSRTWQCLFPHILTSSGMFHIHNWWWLEKQKILLHFNFNL